MKTSKILKRFSIGFLVVFCIVCGLWVWGFWQAKQTLKYYVNIFEEQGCQVEYQTSTEGFPFRINFHVPHMSIKGNGKSILHLLEHLAGSSLLTGALKKFIDDKMYIILTATDIKTKALVFRPFDHKSSAHIKVSIYKGDPNEEEHSKEILSFDLGRLHVDYQNLEAATISPNQLTIKNIILNLPSFKDLSIEIAKLDYKQKKYRYNLRYKLDREIRIQDISLKKDHNLNSSFHNFKIDGIYVQHSVTSVTPSWSDLHKIFIQELVLYKNAIKERCSSFKRTMPPLSPLLKKLEKNKVVFEGFMSVDFKGSKIRIDHTAHVVNEQPEMALALKMKDPQEALNYLVKTGVLPEKLPLFLLTLFEVGMGKVEEDYQLHLEIKEGKIYKNGVNFLEYPKDIWDHLPLLDYLCDHMSKKSHRTSGDNLLKEYQKTNSLNRPGFQFDLGFAYFKEGRYQEAFKWYQKAAHQKNPYALYMIGFMYYTGQGLSKDLLKAKEYAQEAVKYNLELRHLRPTMASHEYLQFAKEASAILKKI